MSAQWTCSYCGAPVELTPTGMARKHKEMRVGTDGPYQTDLFCTSRVASPPDRDLERQYHALLAERFGAPWRRP